VASRPAAYRPAYPASTSPHYPSVGSPHYPDVLGPPGAPILWFDAQDINLLGNAGIADNDPVGTWKNKGSLGTAGDLVQATAGFRPKFKKIASAGKLGNLSGVLADGVDDTMSTAGFAAKAQPNFYIAVMRIDNTAAAWILQNGDGGGVQRNQISSAGTTLNLYAGSVYASAAAVVQGTFHTVAGLFNGATSIAYVDGAAAASGNAGAQPLGAFEIFAAAAGTFFTGYLIELLGYNSAQAEPAARAYLAAKYGVTPQ